MTRTKEAVFVAAIVASMLQASAASAQCTLGLPTDLAPLDGAVITAPTSFGWAPGQDNEAIYLNVATNPEFDPIDVVNWMDDGSHHHTGLVDPTGFSDKTLYWQVVADGCGRRVITPTRSFQVGEVSQDPYYDLYHLPWPGGSFPLWDPHDLASLDAADLEALRAMLGTDGATPDRKLGISFHVPYFFVDDLGYYKALLARLFEVCEAANMPVLIGLDGYEWWGGRPDLWNWWDPAQPGYADANRANVEWTSWSSADAVQGAWRNWGAAFAVGQPHPNVTSPAVLDATRQAVGELATVIADWEASLAPDKKYLFAGVKVGWEVSIGVNYFYPLDPVGCANGAECSPAQAHQVGYAAVATAGIKTSGSLTEADLTQAVNVYMKEISRAAYDAGIPRRKIFTHIGAGSPTPNVGNGTDAAVTPYANPGWSFYTFGDGPTGLAGLETTLSQLAASHWGATEWGGPGTNTAAAWAGQLDQYFHLGNNKLIASFIGMDQNQAQGFGSVIDRVDCWMHPPIARAEVEGHAAKLSWSVPGRAVEVYLNVTTDPTPSTSGSFVTVDVKNTKVTGTYAIDLTDLAPGTYYAMLAADACGRRVLSDPVSFEVSDDAPPGAGGAGGSAFETSTASGTTGAGNGETPSGSGCGCRSVSRGPSPDPRLAALAAALLAVRRRRRHGTRA